MQQDNRDIRYLAEHLLHTGMGGLGERDRMTMIRDFEVNLKSEASIDGLHKRIDHLTWQILSDLEQLKRQQRVAQAGPADAGAPEAEKHQDGNA
ncbi:DUF1003 domain-containing protein [Pseudogulbenkiania sp. MAI-1]|uniref:DUF1003 domain-containing protein n=1 Tax=Pseudogulbenkiania sp. MAI-1 TaxID=990370 RepID=UPI00045EBC7C|nr:DUF1003 domain-containing protein [Pseudogulbenkiania sp. MAI-1]